jgi:hypothetical protein
MSRQACFGGFGKEFVVLANERNVQNIQDITEEKLRTAYGWCAMAGAEDGIEYCIRDGLQSLFWGGENSWRGAERYCRIVTDPLQKDRCFNFLFGLVGHYMSDKVYREKFCFEVSSQYQNTCRESLL